MCGPELGNMGTPDFLPRIAVARRPSASSSGLAARYKGPSASIVVVWVLLDLLTALVAGLIALRIRGDGVPIPHNEFLLRLTHSEPAVSLAYVAAFGVFLVLCSRMYGLYGPSQNRSGLNEQRLTVQAHLTAGSECVSRSKN